MKNLKTYEFDIKEIKNRANELKNTQKKLLYYLRMKGNISYIQRKFRDLRNDMTSDDDLYDNIKRKRYLTSYIVSYSMKYLCPQLISFLKDYENNHFGEMKKRKILKNHESFRIIFTKTLKMMLEKQDEKYYYILDFIKKEIDYLNRKTELEQKEIALEKREIINDIHNKIKWNGTLKQLTIFLNFFQEYDFIKNIIDDNKNCFPYIANFIDKQGNVFTDIEPNQIVWLKKQSVLAYTIKYMYNEDFKINLIHKEDIWKIVCNVFCKIDGSKFNEQSLHSESYKAKPVNRDIIEKLVQNVKSVKN